MQVKTVGPLVVWVVLFQLCLTALLVQHPKPDNHGNPPEKKCGHCPTRKYSAAITTYDDEPAHKKDAEKSEWFDKPTDWLLAVFTFALVVYTRRLYQVTAGLFKETAGLRSAADQQAKDMKESLMISDKAAEAARQSADVLSRAEGAQVFAQPELDEFYKTLTKAWPSFVSEDRSGDSTIAFSKIPIEIINYGKSPATLRDLRWGMVLGPLPDEPFYTKLDWPNKTILADGVSARTSFIPITLSISDFNKAATGQLDIYHYGRILYADAFADDHELRVLWKFDASSKTFWRVYEKSEYNKNT